MKKVKKYKLLYKLFLISPGLCSRNYGLLVKKNTWTNTTLHCGTQLIVKQYRVLLISEIQKEVLCSVLQLFNFIPILIFSSFKHSSKSTNSIVNKQNKQWQAIAIKCKSRMTRNMLI